jgi:hypothetical protein
LLVEFRLLNIFDKSGGSVLFFGRILLLLLFGSGYIVVRDLNVGGFNLLSFSFLKLNNRCGVSRLDNIVLTLFDFLMPLYPDLLRLSHLRLELE